MSRIELNVISCASEYGLFVLDRKKSERALKYPF